MEVFCHLCHVLTLEHAFKPVTDKVSQGFSLNLKEWVENERCLRVRKCCDGVLRHLCISDRTWWIVCEGVVLVRIELQRESYRKSLERLDRGANQVLRCVLDLLRDTFDTFHCNGFVDGRRLE